MTPAKVDTANRLLGTRVVMSGQVVGTLTGYGFEGKSACTLIVTADEGVKVEGGTPFGIEDTRVHSPASQDVSASPAS